MPDPTPSSAVADAAVEADSAEDLYERAPCGYLSCYLDGRIARVNDTFLAWTGYSRDELVGVRRFVDLLSAGGRIYHETHYAPLLRMQGSVQAIALDVLRRDGSQLPVLVNSRLRTGPGGEPLAIRTTVFDATDRKAYETELLEARRRAERATAWVSAVEEVVAALAAAGSLAQVCRVLTAAGPRLFGATGSGVWVEAGAATSRDRWAWVPAGSGEDGEELTTYDALPGSRRLRGGAVVRCAGGPAETTPRQRLGGGDGALLMTPLVAVERTVGVLGLLVPPELAGPDQQRLLATLGQQAGQALERARLADQQRRVATTLQHSMLSATLPTDPRLVLSACYRPAVDGLDVGGDWYDAFPLDQDRTAVTVGDVVGRGLPAAAAMGQLRSAVRALAAVDSGPAWLLHRLDAFVEGVPAAATATLAYAEVDLRDGTMVYACAGHPPPVLVGPEGTAEVLWGGRSTPLGAHFGPRGRSQATSRLHPGGRLALYTDGLVERRGTPLDESIDALVRALAVRRDRPPQALADEVADALLDPGVSDDDVCLLTLTFRADAGG